MTQSENWIGVSSRIRIMSLNLQICFIDESFQLKKMNGFPCIGWNNSHPKNKVSTHFTFVKVCIRMSLKRFFQ